MINYEDVLGQKFIFEPFLVVYGETTPVRVPGRNFRVSVSLHFRQEVVQLDREVAVLLVAKVGVTMDSPNVLFCDKRKVLEIRTVCFHLLADDSRLASPFASPRVRSLSALLKNGCRTPHRG